MSVLGNFGAKLLTALLAAQRKIEGVTKDATNPHFKSKYADLTSVIEATTPTLNESGVVVVQVPVVGKEGHLSLATVLGHAESGEWIGGIAEIPMPKNDPQAYGSALTYGRRYSLSAVTNLKIADDDAESAMPNRAGGPQPQQAPRGAFPRAADPQPEEKPQQAAPPARPKAGLFPTPKK